MIADVGVDPAERVLRGDASRRSSRSSAVYTDPVTLDGFAMRLTAMVGRAAATHRALERTGVAVLHVAVRVEPDDARVRARALKPRHDSQSDETVARHDHQRGTSVGAVNDGPVQQLPFLSVPRVDLS